LAAVVDENYNSIVDVFNENVYFDSIKAIDTKNLIARNEIHKQNGEREREIKEEK